MGNNADKSLLSQSRAASANFAREKTRKSAKDLDHLARDVLDAQAAGMSYGQYKAQHPRTYVDPEYAPPAPKPSPGMRELVCVHCGGKFIAPRTMANKKYCSDECRNRACNIRKPPKVTERACAYCGKVFGAVRGAKYCCGECYMQAQRQKARENARNKKEKEAVKND